MYGSSCSAALFERTSCFEKSSFFICSSFNFSVSQSIFGWAFCGQACLVFSDSPFQPVARGEKILIHVLALAALHIRLDADRSTAPPRKQAGSPGRFCENLLVGFLTDQDFRHSRRQVLGNAFLSNCLVGVFHLWVCFSLFHSILVEGTPARASSKKKTSGIQQFG